MVYGRREEREKMKTELINDHFQNFKRYGIPKAQLIIADIPYSTINNWGFTKDEKTIPIPKWITPFLEHYEKSRKYDYLMKELSKVAKTLEKK